MSNFLSRNKSFNGEESTAPKLLIIPGYCDGLGGTLISLSLLIMGFEYCDASDHICILVRSGSSMEQYLTQAGQGYALKIIQAQDQNQFLKQALQWVGEQNRDWPLLLDNCVWRDFLPIIVRATPRLHLSGRPVFHFCHDLALSFNRLGYLARKFTFGYLAPQVICNSKFTASHVRRIMGNIQGILYQPVDIERFNDRPPNAPPPNLQSILQTGARVMLTASRVNNPGIVGDKNLRALIPVMAHLKATGHSYHGVIVGEDRSPDRINTRTLLETAEQSGVADRFTILPPTFAIEQYYKYADVVVTLAPREPFGRTVVEAIACGVPVVGSQTGGIGEILHHFAPEWTVDPNDPASTAEAIVRVATAPSTPDLLAKGRLWVKAHCSVESYAREMMKLTGLAPASSSRNSGSHSSTGARLG
jgi:glycosyltransferase involved in cell wall biosynthesis